MKAMKIFTFGAAVYEVYVCHRGVADSTTSAAIYLFINYHRDFLHRLDDRMTMTARA